MSGNQQEGVQRKVFSRARSSPWTPVPMDEASAIIMANAIEPCHKFAPSSSVTVGKVLADKVVARCNVPPVRTSIMDGYAVVASEGTGIRSVIGYSAAGQTFDGIRSPGTCIRISTGAVVPEWADAVIKVEESKLVNHNENEETEVEFTNTVKSNQNIRMPGSDVKAGDVLLEAGTVMGAAEIGLLASSGQPVVSIYRKPKLCVMSTGNELVDCWSDQLGDAQIRDTNRPQLMSLFGSLGFKPIDAGIVGDTPQQLYEAIRVAFKFASILVTSGGVSMGERDLLKETLTEQFKFKIHFGRVMMKPGLPSTFASGMYDGQQRIVFALPGNPVSSWVSSLLFVVPSLFKTAGRQKVEHAKLRVRLGEQIQLDARPEYRRAWLQYTVNGLPVAVTTGNQISSRLKSTTGASVLLVLPPSGDNSRILNIGHEVEALVVGDI